LRLFLILMAVLTVFVVSDYCTLAAVDPEEFITTDSHMLDITVKPGPVLYNQANATRMRNESFLQYLRDSGADFLYIPPVSRVPTYSVTLFQQLDRINMKFYHFSYVPLSELKEEDLLYGRMPTTSREIVVDRWVLEDAMEKDGILQNGIEDVSYFLDAQLSYPKTPYAPTIVGISDSGEPSVYIHPAGLVSIAAGGTQITPLSELKTLYPETYKDVELGMDECIAVLNNAGESFADRIGGTFSVTGKRQLIIRDAIEADVLGRVVVSDELAEELMWDLASDRFQIYCRDKDAMKALLGRKASEWEQAGYTVVTWSDRYETTYNAYKAASTMKADARTIVTFSVILVSMVMLYLLQRSRTRERIGMLAVYRLLGIPRRKLVGIFTLETLLVSLTAALPATLLTWGYIQLAGRIPEMESNLILPFGVTIAVYGGLLAYHLLISMLPLLRLLRLPPAQLAAKYDI
jgi:hypothetical protein